MYKIIQIDFELFVQEKHVSHKTRICSLGKLDEKKIISKFQRLVRVKNFLYKFFSCLYS